MPDEQRQPTSTENFLADAEVRRAPRTHPNVFRVFAGIAAGLFIGGGLWGVGQVAYGINRADLNLGAPQQLAMAQASYYATNGKYATEIAELQRLKEAKFTAPLGISAKVLGVCASGWVARLDGELTGLHTYVASTATTNITTASTLATLKLPTCITAAELKGDGISATGETGQVAIQNLKVARTTLAVGMNTSSEAARVSWEASAQCASGEKASYQVTVQEQQPAQKASGAYPIDGEFDLRTITTTKRALKVTNFYNGATYAVAVRGSCTGEFAAAQPVTKTFTQGLPGPYIKVRISNGQGYPIVWGTTYPYVKYEIQYQRSYASGWTTLTSSWVRDGALNADGYAPNYGDQFRARTRTLDGAQTSDWGPTATVTYAGSSGYANGGYSQYQRYTPYGR